MKSSRNSRTNALELLVVKGSKKKPVQKAVQKADTNKQAPREFYDGLHSDKLMNDPVMVSINDGLKIIDRTSLPRGFKGEVTDLPDLKSQIENWQRNNSSASNFLGNSVVNNSNHTVNVCVLGDCGTGKTSLVKQYCGLPKSSQYRSTTGCDFNSTKKYLENEESVCVNIYERGHQDERSNTGLSYMQRIDVFVFVVDVNKAKTFENIESWLNEAKINNFNSKGFTKILVLNKVDLENQRVISDNRAQALADQHGVILVKDVSATNVEKVKEVFDTAINTVFENRYKKEEEVAQKQKEQKKHEELFNLVTQYKKNLIEYLEKEIARQDIAIDKRGQFSNILIKVKGGWGKEAGITFDEKTDITDLSTKLDSIKKLITEAKDIAKHHTNNRKKAPITWFFQANWLRNTHSYNDFHEYFNDNNELKKRRNSR